MGLNIWDRCYLGPLSRRKRAHSGESKNLRNHSQDLWIIGRKFCGKVLSLYLIVLMMLRILDNVKLKEAKTFKSVRAQRLRFFLLAIEGQTSETGVSTTSFSIHI